MSTHRNQDPFSVKLSGQQVMGYVLKDTNQTIWQDGYIPDSNDQNIWLWENIAKYKINILLIFILISFGLLLARTSYLQIWKGDYYQGVAEGNRLKEVILTPNRGLIFDTRADLLVRNIPSYSLFFTPAYLSKDESIWTPIINEIATKTGSDQQELKQKVINSKDLGYQTIDLIEHLNYQEAIAFKLKEQEWPGFEVQERSIREYIFAEETTHLMGYLGKITETEFSALRKENYQLIDWLGKSGLEKKYESQLRGTVGVKNIEVNSRGRELKVISWQDPISGSDLMLHLDIKLQDQAYRAFKEYTKAKNKSRGVVIIMEPKTGGVKTLLSFPSYDNNIFGKKISFDEYKKIFESSDNPLINRAIAGQYPSGSTIKPLIAAAALQEGIVTEQTTFNSTGGIHYDQWFFPDWKAGGHGVTNVIKAIAQSVNTYFYMVGVEQYNQTKGLGVDKMYYYLTNFGFGEKTNIDLPGESLGLVPNREWKWEEKKEPWYPGDSMHMAIGQGDLLVTPIQLVAYVSAIANNGIYLKPQVVKAIREGQNMIPVQSEMIHNSLFSKENIEIVRRGMREGVLTGSSRQVNSSFYTAAGKTGTAQAQANKPTHSWFVGFAPYENPEIAWVVLVENGGESTDMAVPIMKKILDYYFSQKKP